MIKINFTGAQGTGKTTVLKILQENKLLPQETEVVTEVVRKFVREQGLKINEAGTAETQQILFAAYQDVLEKESYLSDRCIIDVLAYTYWLCKKDQSKENRAVLLDQCKELGRLKEKLGTIFYFPIEFDVVPDGTRSVDEQYRKDIDIAIMHWLVTFDIPFIRITGSPEERVAQVLKEINKYM